MLRSSIVPLKSVSVPSIRAIHGCARLLAKNDTSTIDSFKLPSQTSINEWEFKYDFMPKVAQPKIPPVSPEAVKQDIAQTKKQEVESELFNKELNSSVKVEANESSVVRGGESVGAEVEYLGDKGSDPVDSSPKTNIGDSTPKKTVNHDAYVQSSINPEINQSSVVTLDEDKKIDHKTSDVEHAKVIDDVEHDNETQHKSSETTSSGAAKIFGVLGLGAVAGYFWFGAPEKKK